MFSTRAESRTEQNARNTSKSSAAQQRARNDANDDGLFATKRQHFPIVVHALEEQSTMREYDDDDPSFGKTSVRCSTEFFQCQRHAQQKIKMLSSGDKSNENNAKKRLVVPSATASAADAADASGENAAVVNTKIHLWSWWFRLAVALAQAVDGVSYRVFIVLACVIHGNLANAGRCSRCRGE